MTRTFTLPIAAVFALAAAAASAQEQQAGNEASTNTEETFRALIEQCDDTAALMLRARIRLQLPHATEEAATTAQTMLDQAFATCGGGDVEGARTQLAEALAIATAGASESFAEDEPSEVDVAEASGAAAEDVTAGDAEDEDDKPWWVFW